MSIETREDHLKRFFRDDGKAVILPIDHGTAIPVPGLEDPRTLIGELNPHVDGYVVNMGEIVDDVFALFHGDSCFWGG